jgi:hypothetical protein
MSNPFNHPYVIATPNGDGTCDYVEMTAEEKAAFIADQQNITDTDNREEIKETSQRLLSESDWAMLPNCGLTQESIDAYVAYRAELRAIRMSDATEATFPTKPQEVWA